MKENTLFNSKYFIYALFFLLFIIGTLTFRDYGIGIDDKFHRLNGFYWLDYLLSFSDFNDLKSLVKIKLSQISDISLPSTIEYNKYSIIFDVPAAILELALKLDNPKEFYEVRHYLNFIFYFVGCIYFYRLLSLRFNRLISFFGCVLFILSPRIYGESFYNMKDIVFLTFLIMGYFYSFRCFLTYDIKNLVFLSFISAICIQTRIIGLALPLSFIFFYLLSILSKKSDLKYFGKIFLYTIATFLFLIAIWPYLWSSPLKNFLAVINNWSPSIHIFFNGNYIPNDFLPFSYIPLWILISTPVLHIFLFTIGFFLIFKRLYQRLVSIDQNNLSYDLWKGVKEKFDVFISLNFLILMTLVIFLNIKLLNAWKHLYFINVYLIYIGSFGLNNIYIFFKKKDKVVLFINILILSLTLITFKMYKYHPYQGLYFNSLVSDNYKNKFEVDFTALSARHFFERIFESKKNDEKIFIGTASWTPLIRTLDIFKKSEREKIILVGQDFQRADLIFSNNISEVDKTLNDKYDIPKNFSKFYQLKIDGAILYTIYKKNNQ